MLHSRLVVFSVVLFIILALIATTLFVEIKSNPRYFAEKGATYFLHRSVSIGTTELSVGSLVVIKLSDIHVANESWGSRPDIVNVGKVEAHIQLLPLIIGELKFDQLIIDDAHVLLEHDPNGVGNWKKNNAALTTPLNPEQTAKRSRSKLPTLFSLAIRNSGIVFRTSEGSTLNINLNDVNLRAEAEDQPVYLKVSGAYKNIPVDLNVTTQSFDQLHNTNAPFGAHILGEGASASVTLDAQMMDPLNFDQVDSQLDVQVKQLGEMAGLFGTAFSWNVPVHLKSTLKHEGDIWNLTKAKGDFTGNKFNNSQLELIEGAHKQPDNIEVALNFKAIDMKSFLGKREEKKNSNTDPLSLLDISDNPPILLKATIKSDDLKYGSFQSSKLDLHASIIRNGAALDHVSMIIPDGSFSASFTSKSQKPANVVTGQAQLSNLNAKELFAWLGIDDHAIDGNIDADVNLAAKSKTLAELKQTIEGTAAVSIVGGHLSRHLVRLASTDVKSLLDDTEPLAQITCAIAIFRFTNGVAVLTPFEIITNSGTLRGVGQVNLPANTVDLNFQTDPHSTSLFALDLPVQVKGDLDSPNLLPALTGVKLDEETSYSPFHFSQANFAQANPCYVPKH